MRGRPGGWLVLLTALLLAVRARHFLGCALTVDKDRDNATRPVQDDGIRAGAPPARTGRGITCVGSAPADG